jgi:RNA polymerase sigma factor (sigma-70 family)
MSIGNSTTLNSDQKLLTSVQQHRDHAAFAELMRRHGPLVWSVCRRLQLTVADAEDVFQATFLVLYQQSHRLQKQTSLASWLHGIAWRIGMRLKRTATRERSRMKLKALQDITGQTPPLDAEVERHLDQEIGQLPAQYREPLVRCYLLGESHSAAAASLGWPVGTVAGRLARAKEMLRVRLLRRGVVPGLLSAAFAEPLLGALPPGLMERTCRSIQQGGSASIKSLTQGVFAMSWGMKAVLSAGAACVMLVAVGWGAGLLTAQDKGKQEDTKSVVVTPATAPEHPDYQALQGTWRCETRHEVTGELLSVHDLIFKGNKYASTEYAITKEGKLGERGTTSKAQTFVLYPDKQPKVMERKAQEVSQLSMFEDLAQWWEWEVYQYQLDKDMLTLTYSGTYPLKRNPDGSVVSDRSKPPAIKQTSPLNELVIKQTYRRFNQSKPETVKSPAEASSEEEKKLLDQLVKERTDVHKLRHHAYIAGKETMNFLIDSIERLLTAQLDRDVGDAQKEQVALQEAFDRIKLVENIAEAKYKAGSSNLLDLTAAREARVNIELKLLRHKMQPRGGL